MDIDHVSRPYALLILTHHKITVRVAYRGYHAGSRKDRDRFGDISLAQFDKLECHAPRSRRHVHIHLGSDCAFFFAACDIAPYLYEGLLIYDKRRSRMPRKPDEQSAALLVEAGDCRLARLGGYAVGKHPLVCCFTYEISCHILLALRASTGNDHDIAVFLRFFNYGGQFIPVILHGDGLNDFEAFLRASRGYSVCIYVSYLPRPRHFIRADGAVNEEEFADAARDFIHVDGNLGSDSILPVQPNPLNQIYVTILGNKIQELKETTGNRDVSTGGTTGGATAASAIAAMQEAGSKLTRDCSMGSYRAFRKVLLLCIELIRQFYDVPRCFRILGEGGAEDFVRYSNRRLRLQETRGEQGWHLPLFDIRVTAEKQSPYSKMAQNELALQLYGAGFFAPQNAQAALSCLDMMDFEGKDFVQRSIRENADKAARSVELTGEPGPEDIRAGQAPGVLQARLRVAEAGAPR